jgi:hypothetical protein
VSGVGVPADRPAPAGGVHAGPSWNWSTFKK